jgi:hypothetical protein
MKVSFKELIGSEAYQHHAQIYAKAMISVSFLTLLINYFVSDAATLIGTVLLAVGWSLFGTGVLVAAPCYAVYVWIIAKMSEFTDFPSADATTQQAGRWKKIASLWNTLSYVINVYITILVARYYWS